MATAAEIAAFRLLIDEPDNDVPYDDLSLSTRLDAAASSEALAASIWREKAATYTSLVSVSESGSSRQLSDMARNALLLADNFSKADANAPGAPAVRGITMSRITRP